MFEVWRNRTVLSNFNDVLLGIISGSRKLRLDWNYLFWFTNLVNRVGI